METFSTERMLQVWEIQVSGREVGLGSVPAYIIGFMEYLWSPDPTNCSVDHFQYREDKNTDPPYP